MKKYKFRLASVLKVRNIQEQQARAALLLANSQVALAKSILNARREHYDSYLAQSAADRALLSSTSDYMAFRSLQKLAAEGIGFGEQRLIEIQEVADLRKSEWMATKQKVQMLDRLDDRRRNEHRLEADREAAKEVDDIVVTRFGRDER